MKDRGFTLIEVLIAVTLLSSVGIALCTALTQGIRVNRMIYQTNIIHDPLKLMWMRLSSDLRNAQALSDYPFVGKAHEMSIPIITTLNKEGVSQLLSVKYYKYQGRLYRSAHDLSEGFISTKPRQRVVLKNVESIQLSYAHLDQSDLLVFDSTWSEDPYYGIPKAVKVDIKLNDIDQAYTRLIAIPQGRWGRLLSEDPVHVK